MTKLIYVIMQKDMETRQTICVGGLSTKEYNKARDEFSEWLRSILREDGTAIYKTEPQAGFYNQLGRALLLDNETVSSLLYEKELYFMYLTEDETES